MEDNMKLVNFYLYCGKCKHRDVEDDDEPCDSCLNVGARPDSHRPIKWEERRGK